MEVVILLYQPLLIKVNENDLKDVAEYKNDREDNTQVPVKLPAWRCMSGK